MWAAKGLLWQMNHYSDDRRRYERVKRELAAKEWSDMNAYADAKTEVIESICTITDEDSEL